MKRLRRLLTRLGLHEAAYRVFMRFEYVPIAGAESPPAEAAETAPAEGGDEPAPPPLDLGPLTSRMDEVMSRVDSLAERIPAPEPQQPPEDELYGNPQPGQPGYIDPNLDPDDPAVVQQILRAEAQRAAQEALRPELERADQERRQAQFEQMEEEYPELKERDNVQKLGQHAQEWAADLSRGFRDPQLAEKLMGEPAFLELVHLASKMEEMAQQETPAGQAQAGVDLEGAAAANPGAGAPQANLGEQIREAGTPSTFWTQ